MILEKFWGKLKFVFDHMTHLIYALKVALKGN